MRRLLERLLGGHQLAGTGVRRTMRGLRLGDQRELLLGLALVAIAFLRRTAPRKRLIYSSEVEEGSALVIHDRHPGDPRIEVVKPH